MKTCIRTYVFTAIASLALASGAKSQITTGDAVPAFQELERKSHVQLEPLSSVEANEVEPQLINGTPVNPEQFPAIFRMTTGGTCTATAVGPSAILLAAHCVGHLAKIAFVTGGQDIEGICERSPGYKVVDDSQDWAMCLLEFEIGGIPFESVDLTATPAVGDTLVLTGYGCTLQNGPLDGLLRIGVSRVVNKPEAWPVETSTIYTASDIGAGEAVLCPGDSGGPLFRFSGGFEDKREVVGVNSRTTFAFGVSLFSATASTAGSTFLNDWVQRHGQKVCGINMTEGCR